MRTSAGAKFKPGDRVVYRSTEKIDYGIVTRVLKEGMVWVRWFGGSHIAMHHRCTLEKLQLH
jgi:signal peptidase I